jgi:purine-binding chemotaxis protein CheW
MGPHGLEVLIFEVSGRRYGLPAAEVQEVVRAVTIMPLPDAPPGVEGVINVRGRVVPVLDLRSRLRLPARAVEPADHLILARTDERLVALRVDRAVGLRSLGEAEAEAARGAVPGVDDASWLAKLPNELILIHDLRRLLPTGAGGGER